MMIGTDEDLDPEMHASNFVIVQDTAIFVWQTLMTQLIFASDPQRCNVMEYPNKLTAPNIVLFSYRAMPEAEF